MKNMDKEKKRSQDYRKDNKASIAAYQRRYKAENKAKLAQAQAAYKAANRDKIAQSRKDMYRRKKEEMARTVAVGQGETAATGQAGCGKETNSELRGQQERQKAPALVKLASRKKTRAQASTPDPTPVATPAAAGGTPAKARRPQQQGGRCVQARGEQSRQQWPTRDTRGQNAARRGASTAADLQVAKCQEDQCEEVNDWDENTLGDEQARMRREARPWKSTADVDTEGRRCSKADSSAGKATGNGFVNGHRPRMLAKVVVQEDEEEEKRQADLCSARDRLFKCIEDEDYEAAAAMKKLIDALQSAQPCSLRNHGRSQSEWSAAAKRVEQDVEEEERGEAETSMCPEAAREVP